MHTDMAGSAVARRHAASRCSSCARRSRSTAGSRSPRTASVRTPTGRRTSCAPPTARRSRSSTPMPRAAWCSPTRSRSPRAQAPGDHRLRDTDRRLRLCADRAHAAARSPTAEALVPQLMAAGRASGERVWCFPMDEDFDTDIESSVADVVQCAVDGKGDHILAARFLQALRARRRSPGCTWTSLPRRAAAAWRTSAPRSPVSACATRSSCCCGRTRRRARHDDAAHPPARRLAPAPARRRGPRLRRCRTRPRASAARS